MKTISCLLVVITLCASVARAEPLAVPDRTVRRSKVGFITGISLTATGVAGLIGGIAYSLSSQPALCDPQYCSEVTAGFARARRDGGLVIAVIGGVLAAVGIPLLIWGGAKEPKVAFLLGVSSASVKVEF